eukprot:gene2156-1325_t
MNLDSKTVFLVQLSAILSQVHHVLQASTSSTGPTAVALKASIEAWIAAVECSKTGATLETAAASTPTPASAPTAESSSSHLAAAAADASTPTSDPEHSIPEVGGAATAGSPTLPADNAIGDRSLVELVQLVSHLFAPDAPESTKLRMLGRNLIHLVQVRCLSALRESLQYVALLTYSARTDRAQRGRSRPLPPPPASARQQLQRVHSSSSGGSTHDLLALQPPAPAADDVTAATSNNSNGAPSEYASRMLSAVHLARTIRSSSAALIECVELIIFQSDKGNLRFPLQIAVDTLKQLYKMITTFTRLIDRAEVAQLSDGERNRIYIDKSLFDRCVERQIEVLRGQWGAALSQALGRIGRCMTPVISFLVSIAVQTPAMNPAAAAGSGAGATASASVAETTAEAVGTDAAHALFAFAPQSDAHRKSAAAPPEESVRSGSSGTFSPSTVSSAPPPTPFGSFAAVLLARLEVNYTAEFIAALSTQCGDDSEGSLVATRIVTDTLRAVAAECPALLECIVSQRWRYGVFDGILTRIVSMQPAVLLSGLEDLQLITTTCIASPSASTVGGEIGNIYSGCVFRLLESANCPLYAKRQLMLHLLQTFLQYPSPEAHPHASRIPLLLRLYHTFDLDLHAHSLNVVQQFIAVLSRIVRVTTPAEFVKDTEAQEQLLRQLRQAKGAGPSDTAAGSATENAVVSDAEALVVYQQSLPLMALHGLVVAMELLSVQVPPESLVDGAVTQVLPPCDEREAKQREQYLADVFSKSPKKAVKMIVDVTPEMTHPPGSEAYLSDCEAASLPAPATDKVRGMVETVAHFIWTIPSLNAQAVSEYITSPDVFALQVCANLMRRLPVRGLDMVDALDEFLFTFALPKEGQRIERLLEYFCDAYFDANRGPDIDSHVFPFVDKDACYLVAVASVLLTTSLHNPLATKLTEDTFCRQLEACNGPEGFPPGFAKNIFTRIAKGPFRRAVSQALVQTAADNVAASRSIDSLFISTEERRQIAFGLERQRVLMEVHQVLHSRRVPSPPNPKPDSLWWPRVTRDLFLSTWSSVCAVFGPAMYDGAEAPEVVLPKCVRGLQALLCVAASFALSTECEAMLLSILHLCTFNSVRDACRRAVLAVAASPYSVFFSARCWALVLNLICTLRSDNSLPTHVENVLARIEAFIRFKEQSGHLSLCTPAPAPGSGPDQQQQSCVSAATAADRVLEAVMALLQDVEPGDTSGLGSRLELLERCLEFTRIVHISGTEGHEGSSEVANCLSVDSFSHVVLPALQELIRKYAEDEAALQLLGQYITSFYRVLWASLTPDGADREWAVSSATSECFDFFRDVLDSMPESSLVQTRLVQCVGELCSSILAASASPATAAAAAADPNGAIQLSFAVWRRVLYPIPRNLASARSEICSLSGMILRKIVQAANALIASQTREENAPGGGGRPGGAVLCMAPVLLLSNVCYVGAMCSEGDSAHSCVSLLASLSLSAVLLLPPPSEAISLPQEQSDATPQADASIPPHSINDDVSTTPPPYEVLLEAFVAQLQAGASGAAFLAVHTLERLCLLLRGEKEIIRSETIDHLRKLLPSLAPYDGQHELHARIAALLSNVVVAGTVVHSAAVSLVDPTLIAFWVFSMTDVPNSMRRCSRAAFRASLHAILRLLTSDLLSSCPPAQRPAVAEFVMVRCLVVLVVAPPSPPPIRSMAALFLAPCVEMCQGQGSDHAVTEILWRCVSIILYWTLQRWGPSSTSAIADRDGEGSSSAMPAYCGVGWVEAHESLCRDRQIAYAAAAEAAMEALSNLAEPEFTGSAKSWGRSRFARLCGALEHQTQLSQQTSRSRRAAPSDVSAEVGPEHYGLLTNLLSGIPKLLVHMDHEESSSSSATGGEGLEQVSGDGERPSRWSLPPVPPIVLLSLLVDAMSRLFTAFWRLHRPPGAAASFAPSRRDIAGGPRAVMPHTAVRGVLNTFLEVALRTDAYPLLLLRDILKDVAELISCLQIAVQPSAAGGPSAGAGSPQPSAEAALLGAEQLRHRSPQEQQHVRNCHSGMYTELCAALEFWVRRLTPTDGRSTAREREIAGLCTDYQVCRALVQLLPADGNPLIASLKLYFGQQRTTTTTMNKSGATGAILILDREILRGSITPIHKVMRLHLCRSVCASVWEAKLLVAVAVSRVQFPSILVIGEFFANNNNNHLEDIIKDALQVRRRLLSLSCWTASLFCSARLVSDAMVRGRVRRRLGGHGAASRIVWCSPHAALHTAAPRSFSAGSRCTAGPVRLAVALSGGGVDSSVAALIMAACVRTMRDVHCLPKIRRPVELATLLDAIRNREPLSNLVQLDVDASLDPHSLASADGEAEAPVQLCPVHFRCWSRDEERGTVWCAQAARDLQDAEGVAQQLGLLRAGEALPVIDLRLPYVDQCLHPMLEAFARGHTLNIDVLCNEKIKFGAALRQLQDTAGRFRCRRLVTGHYARLLPTGEGGGRDPGVVLLAKPHTALQDPLNDQVHFLSRLGHAARGSAIFPLGHLFASKADVRSVAAAFKLRDVCKKKTSTGVCMLGGAASSASLIQEEDGRTPATAAEVGPCAAQLRFPRFIEAYVDHRPGELHTVGVGGTQFMDAVTGEVLNPRRFRWAAETQAFLQRLGGAGEGHLLPAYVFTLGQRLSYTREQPHVKAMNGKRKQSVVRYYVCEKEVIQPGRGGSGGGVLPCAPLEADVLRVVRLVPDADHPLLMRRSVRVSGWRWASQRHALLFCREGWRKEPPSPPSLWAATRHHEPLQPVGIHLVAAASKTDVEVTWGMNCNGVRAPVRGQLLVAYASLHGTREANDLVVVGSGWGFCCCCLYSSTVIRKRARFVVMACFILDVHGMQSFIK